MQDNSNMLARWAIALQNYDFTVKDVPGKFNEIWIHSARYSHWTRDKPWRRLHLKKIYSSRSMTRQMMDRIAQRRHQWLLSLMCGKKSPENNTRRYRKSPVKVQ